MFFGLLLMGHLMTSDYEVAKDLRVLSSQHILSHRPWQGVQCLHWCYCGLRTRTCLNLIACELFAFMVVVVVFFVHCCFLHHLLYYYDHFLLCCCFIHYFGSWKLFTFSVFFPFYTRAPFNNKKSISCKSRCLALLKTRRSALHACLKPE